MAGSEGITPDTRVKFSELFSAEEVNPQAVTPGTPKTKIGLPKPKDDGQDGNDSDADDDISSLIKREDLYESDLDAGHPFVLVAKSRKQAKKAKGPHQSKPYVFETDLF